MGAVFGASDAAAIAAYNSPEAVAKREAVRNATCEKCGRINRDHTIMQVIDCFNDRRAPQGGPWWTPEP